MPSAALGRNPEELEMHGAEQYTCDDDTRPWAFCEMDQYSLYSASEKYLFTEGRHQGHYDQVDHNIEW